MRLFFATRNDGKVVTLKRVFAQYGIEIEQARLDIVETQANDVISIAKHKAHQAHQILEHPVIAVDSGFFIPKLCGFPGPYVAPVTQGIGIEGYLRLLEPWQDTEERAAFFEDAVVLVDGLHAWLFSLRQVWGTIALEPGTGTGGTGKSVIDRIFIPKGESKVLCDMTPEELHRFRSRPETEKVYHDLAKRYLENLRDG